MRYTFSVPYKTITVSRVEITVEADRYEQAESNMLAAALQKNLEIIPEWSLIKREDSGV